MPNETNDLPPSVNHIFVDYENVHGIDHTIIGSKTVHVTLLLGAKNTKFDATVVEKLVNHAANVEIVRLASSGRNAVDFALTYYLGRAVLADPSAYFHVISKDKGYDALIEHLRSKHIRARRHDDFATLTFSAPAKPSAVTARAAMPVGKPPAPATAAPSPPKPLVVALSTVDMRVWEYLRKPTTNRPRTKAKLASHLLTHLANKVAQPEVVKLIMRLARADKLVIGEKDMLTYRLDQP